ncbi:beta-galactosidase family protein [Luteibacter sp. 22Crub2.1]|uniref:glycoside hydrolase family 35 protein n=1 Tax=Luteibacter sp. 22Crub2.1 TaxID=1283288 RepID=UPI0009C4AD38|nr:beta-galactosidase family protein [Luteibacter sp. 22Crub2.1]SKB48338.1 beta-galactosidase [Luteibacter sp. 22Crub2.1]
MKPLSLLLSTCLAASAALPLAAVAAPAHFAVENGQFLLDGKPYVIRSGEMHYPRIPHAEWRDRLRKARAMGLNTITTYAFWNVSEPEPGKFDFTGDNDIATFVRTAQEEGLNVIVRPGPFVCAEWEFGGFPAWLLRTPGLRVRSYDARFLSASAAWFKRLGQELAPLQSTRGGPILMMQVENEYGYVGNDRDYMAAIRQQMLDAGFDVPFFMSNGPGPTWMSRGTLPGMLSVINFTGDATKTERAFRRSAAQMEGMPKMAGEYWSGWYDRWGEEHKTRSTEEVAGSLGWMLDHNISFNLYMVDGGTNFGWMNGANNDDTHYLPVTTSYDYDSPIDEAGRLTPKYDALRKVIAAHLPKGEHLPKPPASSPTTATARVELRESVGLLDALPTLSAQPRTSVTPQGMESFGQNYGLILYRKKLDNDAKGKLDVNDVHDYATVLTDGHAIGTLDRRKDEHSLPVDLEKGSTLDLIVENMGRINIGPGMEDDYKGITFSVELAGEDLTQWTVYPLPLNDLSGLKYGSGAAPGGPGFWHGTLEVPTVAGTFLDMRGWHKGNVWINGHHLGRFWEIGPQQSLYVPASWLHKGRNDVVVLEMQGGGSHSVAGMANPVFSTKPAP